MVLCDHNYSCSVRSELLSPLAIRIIIAQCNQKYYRLVRSELLSPRTTRVNYYRPA